MDIRRVKFNRARVKQLVRDHTDGKKLPTWATNVTVQDGILFIENHEVVPNEDVDDWLRKRVYGEKTISFSRDSGYTDHIAKETLGISRRKWFDFLKKQDTHQRYTLRPKAPKHRGQKLNRRGTCQMDLVEAKSKDIPTRKTDTYIFTLIDRLTSFLVAKRVDTKEVNPKKKRGTLIVCKELFEEMEEALGTKIHTIESDKGGEFMAGVAKWFASRGTTQKFVPLGAAVESRNGMVQRHLYKMIALGRKGGFDKHLKDAVELCNQTTSRITKRRPVDALAAKDSELALLFNKKRQAPGKKLGPKISKGDTVLILSKARKADKFYKSYRDHWSTPVIVEAIKGLGVKVDGDIYPRSRIKKVVPVDKKSIKLMEDRKPKKKKAKKKGKQPIVPREKSARLKALQAKKKH